MGVVLERSKIAEVLLTTMGQLFGSVRGGLGLSVVIVGALLAASTGVVGATVVAMGLLALPAMMRAGYDPKLATGVICAAGTLGQIIPPSTVLIFTADILQGANAAAQLAMGNLRPTPCRSATCSPARSSPASAWRSSMAVGHVSRVARSIVRARVGDDGGRACRPWQARRRRSCSAAHADRRRAWLHYRRRCNPTESASVGSLGAILLAVVKQLAEHYLGSKGEAVLQDRLFKFWIAFLALIFGIAFFGGAFGLLTFLIIATSRRWRPS